MDYKILDKLLKAHLNAISEKSFPKEITMLSKFKSFFQLSSSKSPFIKALEKYIKKKLDTEVDLIDIIQMHSESMTDEEKALTDKIFGHIFGDDFELVKNLIGNNNITAIQITQIKLLLKKQLLPTYLKTMCELGQELNIELLQPLKPLLDSLFRYYFDPFLPKLYCRRQRIKILLGIIPLYLEFIRCFPQFLNNFEDFLLGIKQLKLLDAGFSLKEIQPNYLHIIFSLIQMGNKIFITEQNFTSILEYESIPKDFFQQTVCIIKNRRMFPIKNPREKFWQTVELTNKTIRLIYPYLSLMPPEIKWSILKCKLEGYYKILSILNRCQLLSAEILAIVFTLPRNKTKFKIYYNILSFLNTRELLSANILLVLFTFPPEHIYNTLIKCRQDLVTKEYLEVIIRSAGTNEQNCKNTHVALLHLHWFNQLQANVQAIITHAHPFSLVRALNKLLDFSNLLGGVPKDWYEKNRWFIILAQDDPLVVACLLEELYFHGVYDGNNLNDLQYLTKMPEPKLKELYLEIKAIPKQHSSTFVINLLKKYLSINNLKSATSSVFFPASNSQEEASLLPTAVPPIQPTRLSSQQRYV